MILCDTGVLLCLVDRTQPGHLDYIALVNQLEKPLVTTWVCMGEAMYLALHRGGWPMQKQLTKLLLLNLLVIGEIDQGNYPRLFALMEKYQDRPMDLADATLVLMAEKQGDNRILTIDSDFLFYRILDKEHFQILSP
jgi:predicted nucleic acid-binding protein